MMDITGIGWGIPHPQPVDNQAGNGPDGNRIEGLRGVKIGRGGGENGVRGSVGFWGKVTYC